MKASGILKLIITATILSTIACSGGGSGNGAGGGNGSGGGGLGNFKTNGGVGVGNNNGTGGTAVVPMTLVSMDYPKNWNADTSNQKLAIKNENGSVIVAAKYQLADFASPTTLDLAQYLKTTYPERSYKSVSINGLKGMQADLVDNASQKQSDLYLISELQDFVHIQSDLKKSENGITEGDGIIATVKLAYRGVALTNSPVKTVTLAAYSLPDQTQRMKAAYSFNDDCYTYVDSGCYGVSILFSNGEPTEITLGNAGYEHGRIVELGTQNEIPFDSIKIDGPYLAAPLTKISIEDIYTAFEPKDQHQELDRLNLKEGSVYLARTINWPDEDLITKFKVEKIQAGQALTITYQKLISVPKAELQKEIDAINEHTLKEEAPLSEGQVTLYNRAVWNNYFYSAFNFQYSTSGNMYITHNGWDVMFETGCDGKPSLQVPYSGSSIGDVIDLGSKEINSVSQNDLPDPNTFKPHCGVTAVKGHTYAIYKEDYDNGDAAFVFGAVHINDFDSKNSSVQLEFRRIKLGPAQHFQKWIELEVPSDVQKVSLSESGSTNVFYPFIMKRGDQGSHYYERLAFETNSGEKGADQIYVDSRPYGPGRGFYDLGQNVALDSVTLEQIENLRGKFSAYTNVKSGDVLVAYLENYYDKTVMVMRVDENAPGESVQLSIKYLERAKTGYSDDKN